MTIESNYRRVGDLNKALPADNDPIGEGDDHLRGIKSSLVGNIFSSATELWFRLVETGAKLLSLTDGNLKVIPSTGSTSGVEVADSGGVARGRLGTVANVPGVFGIPVVIYVADDVGALQPAFAASGDPAAPRSVMYAGGLPIAETTLEGMNVFRDPSQTDQETKFQLKDDYNGNIVMSMIADDIANLLTIATGGANRELRLVSATNGLISAYNGATEKLQLLNDVTRNTQGRIADAANVLRSIGMNEQPVVSFSGNRTIQNSDLGAYLRYTGGTGTLTLGNKPVGTTVNIGSVAASDLIIAATTLNWLIGGDVEVGTTRTLATGGFVSVVSVGTNEWDIVGSGLS